MDNKNIFSVGDFITIERPLRMAFNPLPDITAYELAILLPYFHGKDLFKKDYEEMGNEKRHLKVVP